MFLLEQYVFGSLEHAHRCLDGDLGAALSERTRSATGLVPLGYWDNGFRHLSNRSREIRTPEDCRGLRVRLQPNWAHELHPYVTLTGHVYGARGVYASAVQLRDWNDDDIAVLRTAVAAAIDEQRGSAARVEAELQEWLAARGTKIHSLTDDEADAFREAAAPVVAAALPQVGSALLAAIED